MKRGLLLLLLLAARSPAAEPAASPALNWVLPIFSDREGYRVLTARGSEARPPGPDGGLLVTNLHITVFAGDASNRVETVFMSPLAKFHAKDNHAGGDQTVRIVRDDLEASARTWAYDHAQKHVTLTGNVRIVFNSEIKNLLK